MSEDQKTGDPKSGEPQIDYKAELEKLKGENESLKKSNEDLRLEFMSEDYLDFLNHKDGKPAPAAKPAANTAPDEENLKGLTPEQIYEKALKAAEEKINSKLTEFQQKQKEESDARTAAEVKKFAETHPDFERYRPMMYGLSLDPKNANDNLQELYAKAKEHVKALAGASEEEKEKSRRSGGEKPGYSTSSFKRDGKKLSAEEAYEEAWEEAVGKDGLPPAF